MVIAFCTFIVQTENTWNCFQKKKNWFMLTTFPLNLFLSKEKIQNRVIELSQIITSDYKGKKPIFLGILNGAFIFVADLVRACDLTCETTFIKLSSYDGVKSSGNVTTLIGMDIELKGRDVIVVEDIIDTGKTLFQFLKELRKLEPRFRKTCIIVNKT